MRLPTGYFEIIADGAALLRAVAAQLRAEAARRPSTPELWLAVRDFEGLAGRLAETQRRDWESGFANLLITGQDLGALDDLIATGVVANGQSVVAMSSSQAERLARLEDFLRRYLGRDFASGAPAD
jgi:hypothetical protein